MNSHRRVLLVLLVSLSLLGGPLAIHAEPPDLSTAMFGAVESYYRPEDALEAGIGWDRVIFEWQHLQPTGPDDWETERWEPILRRAQRDGRRIVGLIKNAPKWATGSDLLGAPPKGLDLPIDDPDNLLAAFVTRLVRYYGPKWGIHNWIIYNEPDIRPGDIPDGHFEFAGEVEDYFKVLKVAYKAAHAADPEVVIHLAGLTYWFDHVYGREQYIRKLIRLARSDPEGHRYNLYFDVLTIHTYGGTDWVWRITQYMRSVLASMEIYKPMWINEINVRVTSDGDWPLKGQILDHEPEITVDDQASFIIQGAATAMAMGAQRMLVYRLYDDNYDRRRGKDYESWGLIRPDGSRRPGFYALKTANQYFRDVTGVWRVREFGVVLILLFQPGQTTYVLWNERTEPVNIKIRVNDGGVGSTIISPTGQVEPAPAGTPGDGMYEFDLKPCVEPCMVKGEPVIFIQAGRAQPVVAYARGKSWVLYG